MMKKLMVGIVLTGVLLLGLNTSVAYAAGLAEDRVVFGGDASVGEGEVVDGNLVVFGGDASVAEDARVTGSVVVFGGDASLAEGSKVGDSMVMFGGRASVAGEIGEDLIVFGGGSDLESTAEVGGEVVSFGGRVTREEGSRVGEDVTDELSFTGPWPRIVVGDRGSWIINSVLAGAAGTVINASVLAVLALLVVLFLPDQTSRVAGAVSGATVPAGGMGLLTGVAAPVLILLTAITICLIPFSLLAAVVLVAALLMGWIAIGSLVGERLAAAFNWQSLSPAATAALGTFLFTLALRALSFVTCIGWLVWLLAWLPGLGAVVLTRFGTRTYLPPASLSPETI